MSRERYAVSYQSGGSRPLLGRVAIVLLILLAVTFLLLARAQHPLIGKLRAGALDILTPAAEFISTPIRGLRNITRDKNMLFGAYDENKKLRAELEDMRHWQETAAALKAENEALRGLANYSPVEDARYITARVTGQSPSGYSARITLNAGRSEGVALLQPVIDAYGLIGRISEVGEHTSQVLLLSDSLSRVPVISARTRTHAILAGTGQGDALMRLTFLGQENAAITVGESVVTTEQGGLIPGGIAIGTVFKRDAEGFAVQPLRPLAQSEYVRIVVVKDPAEEPIATE